MNSLSWLLYLSEVIPGIIPLFVLSGFAAIAAAVTFFIIGCHERDQAYWDVPGTGAAARAAARETPRWQSGYAMQKRAFKVAPICFAFFLCAALIPSKQTILMIAASEMGETVIKTPEAKEVFSDLQVILKKQLEALKK